MLWVYQLQMRDDESCNVSYAVKSCFFPEVFMLTCKRGYCYFFYQLVSSPCGHKPTEKAFLFSLVNELGWRPETFGLKGGYHIYATYSCSGYGPTFGNGHDIHIASEASLNTGSYSNLGSAYNLPSGVSSAQTFLAGSYHFQPDEMEVFYETNYK